MEFWITKECGNGWDDTSTGCHAWGVSDRQRRLAERISVDDVLLHYVDSARAWAGYSKVTATLRVNDRDENVQWRNALPWMLPIKAGKWLTRDQSELTETVPHLPDKNYFRQACFTRVPHDEASHIVNAIDKASVIQRQASQGFCQKWMKDADAYYRQILMDHAAGKCFLCGENVAARAAKLNLELSELSDNERDLLHGGFLDAAHLDPKSKSGKLTPDNTRALCPSCHRIFDRLPERYRDELRTRN